MKPKTVLALAVALAIGGVAMWMLVGRGRAERERSSGKSATAEASEGGTELSPPTAVVGEVEARAALEARTEVTPTPAEARPPQSTEPPGGEARLLLEVVSREEGFPLPGIRLALIPTGEFPTTQNSQRGESSDHGRAELAVQSGTEYSLYLQPEPDEGETRTIAVPRLAVGETRALRVELGTGNDLAWWGIVLDGETERPPADASFALVGKETQGRETYRPVGPDGKIEAEVATWREDPEVVAMRAPGYATGFALPSRLHASSEAPQRVLLWRTAALELRVEGGDGQPTLSVSTDSWRILQTEGTGYVHWIDTSWEGMPSPDGVVLYEELPAKVELAVKATLAGRVLRQEALVLEPGERRELAWNLGSGASIEGRAVERDGAAVAGLEVWLVSERESWGGLTLAPESQGGLLGRVESGDDGRFTFEDVSPGWYLVGPSPRPSFDARLRDIAPQAVRLEIAPGVASVPVELVCWRGLEIRGRLLDPEGRPVSGHVYAYGPDGHVSEDTEGDGTFALGPLAPGTYRVSAASYGSGYADSVEVMAEAGDEGLELRLQSGGSLRVRVVDEKRRPMKDIEVSLVPEDQRQGAGTRQSTDASGEAHMVGLHPGRYLLVASGGMLFGLRSEVDIAVGAPNEVVELVLEPAAQLTIRVAEDDVGYQVRWNDHAFVYGGFPDRKSMVTVPPGEIVVELLAWNESEGWQVRQEKRIRVSAGEQATVVFDAPAEAPR